MARFLVFRENNIVMDIKQAILKSIYAELTAEERSALEHWLAEDEEHRRVYERVSAYLKEEDAVAFLATVDVEGAWQRLKRRQGRRLRRVMAVAASVAAVVALVMVLWTGKNERPEKTGETMAMPMARATMTLSTGEVWRLGNVAEVERAAGMGVAVTDSVIEIRGHDAAMEGLTEVKEPVISVLDVPRGEWYSLVLADGTRVRVNALSKLEFPLSFDGQAERRVKLSGEAFFEVAKDGTCPFRVETRRQTITVTGTAFNVTAYADMADRTTLCEGSVEVMTNQGKQLTLVPGQQLVVDEAGQVQVREVDVTIFTAWMDGVYYFDGKTLEEVFLELGRWFDVREVRYDDPTLAQRTFSGKLVKASGLATILAMIEKGTTARIHYADGVITIEAK